MPRTVIVAQTDDYLVRELTSGLFRFVDDVEFYVDSVGHQIQFRSASRMIPDLANRTDDGNVN